MNVGSGGIRVGFLTVTGQQHCRLSRTHFTDGLRGSEKWVARETYGPQKHEVTGEWRTLDNEELHNFNFPSNSIIMIRSGSMGWARHVARTREKRIEYRI
jgi:hypothetical protein